MRNQVHLLVVGFRVRLGLAVGVVVKEPRALGAEVGALEFQEIEVIGVVGVHGEENEGFGGDGAGEGLAEVGEVWREKAGLVEEREATELVGETGHRLIALLFHPSPLEWIVLLLFPIITNNKRLSTTISLSDFLLSCLFAEKEKEKKKMVFWSLFLDFSFLFCSSFFPLFFGGQRY